MKIIVVLASRSFIYYVINVYVPRVRANAYQVLTTPPRVFRDPKMGLRNIWTAPYFFTNIGKEEDFKATYGHIVGNPWVLTS